jgi:hypothetical protein
MNNKGKAFIVIKHNEVHELTFEVKWKGQTNNEWVKAKDIYIEEYKWIVDGYLYLLNKKIVLEHGKYILDQ